MAKRESYSWLLKFHNILYSKKQECPYKKKSTSIEEKYLWKQKYMTQILILCSIS